MSEKHYAMAIDVTRCIGCSTCAMACKVENNLPQGIWWNRVITDGGEENDAPAGEYPSLKMNQYTVSCQHCENPACAKVCPVGATYKDEQTGVVIQDFDKCIGCRMCMTACPYTGVRSFNWDEPVYALDYAIGDVDAPSHQKHTVEKCTFCRHRLEKGLLPACVDVCPGRARIFGDLNDPDSEISKALKTRNYKQLLDDRGTNPSLFYLL